jgi:hypothetical protein
MKDAIDSYFPRLGNPQCESASAQLGIRSHDLARTQIDAWRGRCLDLFARGETAVAGALIALSKVDQKVCFPHLAGQRLAELEKVLAALEPTKKQAEALGAATNNWRELCAERAYFSHGVVTELITRRGEWHARLDFAAFKAKQATPQRRVWSRTEADTLQAELQMGFEALSRELGHVRSRLGN